MSEVSEQGAVSASTGGGGRVATVVVLNWNGARLLPDCLDALAKQDLDPARWETWVVDNGSTDGSQELLTQAYPTVRLVENGANLGYAGGNNAGLRAVTTPFVVLLNNDARPEPDWLRRLLAEAQAPGHERVAAVTSKLLFEPRFVPLDLATPADRQPTDPRELGVQVSQVVLDGDDVTDEVLWDHGAYGAEHDRGRHVRWTFPSGRLLIPLGTAPSSSDPGSPAPAPPATPGDGRRLVVTARAARAKPLHLRWPGGEATLQIDTSQRTETVTLPPTLAPVDVINNVGSYLHLPGYGADRGYQEVDAGQYDTAEDVFLMCGAATCLRTEALHQVGVFDDDFFLYYEDTDLSWRLQAAGWRIRYTPEATVRHLHSASSGEWSPLFTFHVERNRLLAFTKNAPAGFAARLVLWFQLTTLSMLRRSVLQALRQRRRPALRPLLLRARVTASYLRLLPRMLGRRRKIRRMAQHSPQDLLDRWMLPVKPEPTLPAVDAEQP